MKPLNRYIFSIEKVIYKGAIALGYVRLSEGDLTKMEGHTTSKSDEFNWFE